jgi:hypothetical protein
MHGCLEKSLKSLYFVCRKNFLTGTNEDEDEDEIKPTTSRKRKSKDSRLGISSFLFV